MLRDVASVCSQEYIKDKILAHGPASYSSNSFLFSVLSWSVLIFPLKIWCFVYIVVLISEAYSQPCQTSKMEFRYLTRFWKLLWMLGYYRAIWKSRHRHISIGIGIGISIGIAKILFFVLRLFFLLFFLKARIFMSNAHQYSFLCLDMSADLYICIFFCCLFF